MSLCAKCTKPLEVEVENFDSDDEDVDMGGGSSSAAQRTLQTVPDDVLLPCGDHFHWVSPLTRTITPCLLRIYVRGRSVFSTHTSFPLVQNARPISLLLDQLPVPFPRFWLT